MAQRQPVTPEQRPQTVKSFTCFGSIYVRSGVCVCVACMWHACSSARSTDKNCWGPSRGPGGKPARLLHTFPGPKWGPRQQAVTSLHRCSRGPGGSPGGNQHIVATDNTGAQAGAQAATGEVGTDVPGAYAGAKAASSDVATGATGAQAANSEVAADVTGA